jgi:hypothetical protein
MSSPKYRLVKAKYRLVKEVNNAAYVTDYVIEKRKKFLWFEWWSTNYLFDIDGCYSFSESNEKEALNMLSILNGEKEWIHKTVIM